MTCHRCLSRFFPFVGISTSVRVSPASTLVSFGTPSVDPASRFPLQVRYPKTVERPVTELDASASPADWGQLWHWGCWEIPILSDVQYTLGDSLYWGDKQKDRLVFCHGDSMVRASPFSAQGFHWVTQKHHNLIDFVVLPSFLAPIQKSQAEDTAYDQPQRLLAILPL